MTRSFLILMFIFFANISNSQNDDYSALWSQVYQLEIKDLPKSALEIVNTIDTKAQSANNSTQIIKVLLFKSKFVLILEEDAQLKIISEFKSEIAKSTTPTKNVLQNVLANLYWQYYLQNRYKFFNRTKTSVKFDKTDFRTWDLQTLYSETHYYFEQSLNNGLLLQQTKLKPYDAIINTAKNSRDYRPTLFDFLSHNALNFYKSKDYNITKPAYKFEIDNPTYLSAVKQFSELSITSKDTMSLELNALKIYQNLIAFHQKGNTKKALADVNISRLKYVYKNARFTDKDQLLETALQVESDKNTSNATSALYNYELAVLYSKQGNTYTSTKTETARWKLKEAIALCTKTISKFPKSKGAEQCEVLKTKILAPSLVIQNETFLPIEKHSKFLLTYKNIENVSFLAYKLTEKQHEKYKNLYRDDEVKVFIETLSAKENWQAKLKTEGDYQTHSTETATPKLSNGRYLIVGKSNDSNKNLLATSIIQVTNTAIVEYNESGEKHFQFINRNNGAPITNAKVKITYQQQRNKTTTDNLITNTNGVVSITKKKNSYRNVYFEIQNKNDIAYFGSFYLRNYYKSEKEKDIKHNAFVFTDRSIYRPGQTVYFKAIAMQTANEKTNVSSDIEVTATLFNTNRERLNELKLKTNTYGSVAGEFILPTGGLTGNYFIELTATNKTRALASFSVEEYKRPKFETTFKPITKTYKVNDQVTVNGNALAYAGSSITDAKVVYRVKRKVNYPHWYYWSRHGYSSEAQEISYGETITDTDGNFKIDFKAIPDQSVDKKGFPVFKYEITADVTDLNGETRSATTIINVGYHALIATISVKDKLDKTQKDHNIEIDTKNLNSEFVPAKGTLKIYKLKAPETVLRKRPWKAPDYQLYNETEFKKLFLYEAYKNEDHPQNWEKGKLVYDEKFDTSKSKTLKLSSIKKWDSGRYIISLESKDQFGQLVKDEARTSLFKGIELYDNELFTIRTNKDDYKSGDQVELVLGSSAQDIFVTVMVEKEQKIIDHQIIKLNRDIKTISIPVTKNDLGGFVVHYSFSAYNSFQSGIIPIKVPYPKTDLEIETLTFRDKLKPGQDETWTFKIKGPKGDKVSAELLAGMYDASLDQFKPHHWQFNPIQHYNYKSICRRNASQSFSVGNFNMRNYFRPDSNSKHQKYDQLNWFGLRFENGRNYLNKSIRGLNSGVVGSAPMIMKEAMSIESSEMEAPMADSAEAKNSVLEDYKDSNTNQKEQTTKPKTVQIRKNLQETAFFFPQLQTDKKGNVSFSFTTPEALTQWKLQLLAHTKALHSVITSLETVTQKELMVVPNAPRFLREGDKITISTKIANLTKKELSGTATLQLFDALSGKIIDNELSNAKNNINFTVSAKGNTQTSWNLTIPENIQAVQYKIIAKAGNYSDGEQNALPVLTNRMLVTETMPIWIRSNETRTFTLDKLKNTTSTSLSNHSTSLKHHKLTLEMTSNPAWYAVQALPYLMEYPYDCNEQTFSRYYANALASYIANSNPRIKAVFEQWKNTNAVVSNLEKNQDLKSLLIQETPWLRDAQSESEQKKRIALLFDLNKMKNELDAAKRKLENNQMSSGAWSWFNGGRENRFITQHIITGFGHLKQLNVSTDQNTRMIEKAIRYLDQEFVKDYKNLRKYDAKADLSKDRLSHTQLHYLYMRSFFPQIKKSNEVETIITYYHSQIKNYWLKKSLYSKGMMALVTHRLKDNTTSAKILKSLKENSITSEELGMYWKENTNSWYWYQAPIETQSLLIEAFSEIENDVKTVDNLKIWLLKNKQTNRWKTTKATSDAVYALLLQGSDWLSVTDAVSVNIGGKSIVPSKLENVKVEAGTGYYKTAWTASEISPEMATIKISKKDKGIAWGGLYWQYFEDLDKITTAETPLKLKKQLFLKSNTNKGEKITAITENTALKVGDLVRVRIELRSDRTMEFVHMKDMRAAGFEPVNVLSHYKWQDDLGYYESTKDASTNFFFDYLPKGVFVFEYDLRVNNAGNMSNGITTIQSMYAPEFSSHSEGIRVKIESRQ